MRKNILVFIAVLIMSFVFVNISFCETAELDTILANIEKKNSVIKDMQAEYSQVVTYSATDEKIVSDGIFKYKKQNYINLIQLSPARQYTYIDGKTITTYVPANKQAIVEKWKNVVENDVMLTSVFKFTKNFKTLNKDYNVILKSQDNINYVFVITPVNKKENWKMTVTVAKVNSLITASSFDNGNYVVDIEMKNYKTNSNFSNDIFKFVAPKNVEVIEL